MLAPLMLSLGSRALPLILVLAAVGVVLALALTEGWFSGSGSTSTHKPAFVASDSRRSAKVWAVGDGPDGASNAAAVARMINRSKPDRVLYLGDVYEEGTPDEFAANFDPLYGQVAKKVAPTPGNHDWPQHTGGYDVYWKRKQGRDVQWWYSFKTGGWQILSLNSEMDHDPGSPQVSWLKANTKAKGTCKLAFWHRPRYSAGDHHGDDPTMQPFWDVLKGRAALIVNGHEHDMQRFKPRDGITQFVSGAGGNDLYAIDRSRTDLAFGNQDKYGALRLDLSPGLARFRFVSVQGKTLDSGRVRCKTAG
jgi:acid phosphatase type 7